MTTDPIAAARALIEPLTGYTPGPWRDWKTGYVSGPEQGEDGDFDLADVRLIAAAPDLRDMVATLADALEAARVTSQRATDGWSAAQDAKIAALERAAKVEAERDHWKQVARRSGICMSCGGPNGPVEVFGRPDCLNTGWSSEYHNGMADAQARADCLQQDLDVEKFRSHARVYAAYEAAAELIALDHVCDAIRALTPSDAQAALDKMLAAARAEAAEAALTAAAGGA